MVGNTKPYYSDAFTSDLRWALLGIGIFFGIGFLMLGVLYLWSLLMDVFPRRKDRVPRWIDWGAPDEIELPQDHAVKIVDEPFDQDFIFDWSEWERKLSR